MKNQILKKALAWFTIVEILVWVTLLAILWAWAYSVVSNSKEKTQTVASRDNLTEVFKAVEYFKRDSWAFPKPVWIDWVTPSWDSEVWYLSVKWAFNTYLAKQKTDANWIFAVWSDWNKIRFAIAWQYFAVWTKVKNSDWNDVWAIQSNLPWDNKVATLIWPWDWMLDSDAIAKWYTLDDNMADSIPLMIVWVKQINSKVAEVTFSQSIWTAVWAETEMNANFTWESSTWTAWTKASPFLTNADWSALTDNQQTVRVNFTNDIIWLDAKLQYANWTFARTFYVPAVESAW